MPFAIGDLAFAFAFVPCALLSSVLFRVLLFLVFFLISLYIGVPLCFSVFQWRQCFWGLCCPSYPPTALSPLCIGDAPQPSFFQLFFCSIRILSCLLSYISVWRVSTRFSGSPSQLAGRAFSLIGAGGVFGVKCKDLGVRSDV